MKNQKQDNKKLAMPGQSWGIPAFGLYDKIFHQGWKTTFLFSALTTISIYFTFIIRLGFANKYVISVIVFIVIYAFIAKLMVNLRT